MMGSPESENGRAPDELLHKVILTHGFWIAETELTQGQWQEVMGTGLRGDRPPRACSRRDHLSVSRKESGRRFEDYLGLGRAEVDKAIGAPGPAVPIYWVNWPEAVECGCQRFSETGHRAGKLPASLAGRAADGESMGVRLPRLGAGSATYAGDLNIAGKNNAPILDDIAWYGGNSGVRYAGAGWDSSNWPEKGVPRIRWPARRAVAGKRANSWGLCDALGNVLWKWCADWQS